MNETILRNWFAAIRDAAIAAQLDLPADIHLKSLPEAKFQILMRLDQCAMLGMLIRRVEGVDASEAEAITEGILSELVVDVSSGILDARESRELLRFVSDCMANIGKMPIFIELFRRALDGVEGASRYDLTDLARKAKKKSDETMSAFLAQRKKEVGQ